MDIHGLTKIIIADDDEDILTIAKFCLEDLKGVDVKYCTSGEEAIQIALTSPPDMILLDVMMPKMDGIDTLKALRLIPKLSSIPVVFFTAKVQKNELNKFREIGCYDVIAKPFDPLTLSHTILGIWKKYQESH